MNKLILSYVFTSASMRIFSFLIPLLFLSIQASPLLITIAYAVAFSPYLIVTPFAGALCDRFNKKYMMLYGELLATLSIAMIVLMPVNDVTIPLILLLVFIAASAGVIHHPTFQSIIPSIVPLDFREKFNAKINGIDNVINIFAPLSAGSLLIFMTHQQVLWLCMVLNGISFLIIAYLNYQQHPNQHAQATKGIFLSMWDGLQYVIHQPVIKSACMMFVITNFGISLFGATIPYVFMHDLGANERTLSICFAIMGAGALLGSFVSVKLMTRFHYGTIIVGASCFTSFCYFISACFNNYFMIAGLMCLTYGANSSVVVSFFTLRQKIVPAALLGRVTATTRMLVYAVIPFAAITSGYFLNNGGHYKQLLLISGTLIFLGVLYGRKTPLFGAGDNIKKPL